MSRGRVYTKICLVTGAGSGIGRATATALADEDATVIVSDVNGTAAEEVAAGIREKGGRAVGIRLDVTDEAAWIAAIEAILAAHRRLDVVVNNAGVPHLRPITETTLEEWHRIQRVNLDGVFLGTKHAILAMRRQGSGSIINVASVTGLKAYRDTATYSASKAGVRQFSKVAAIECADANTGIRVNVVSPGGVKTPIWDSADFFQSLVDKLGGREAAFAAMAGKAPSRQYATAEDIARTILYLASDESSHLTGTELVIANGHAG
jgi:NAD(P)-dependent dehydrogenase (short-subunit alcohol dehydrogenase family)